MNENDKSPAKMAFQRIFPLLKPHKKRIALVVACMLGASGFSAATAYLIKPAMDEIFVAKDLLMLKVIPFLFLVVTLFNGLCEWGSDYNLKFVGLSVVSHLRRKLYDHIQDMPVSFFDRMPTGMLMSRITSDVNEITGAVTKGLTGFVRDLFTIIGLLFVIFYQNWQLASIGIIVLPAVVYPLVRFGSRIRKLATKRQKATASLNIMLHETLGGARIVKAFGMEDYEKKRFAEKNERVLGYMLKSEWVDAISSPVVGFLGALAIAAVIGFGGYQVINGISTPGTFFSFLGAILMLYRPLKDMSKVNNVLQRGVASTIRVYDVLDLKSPMVEKPDAIELPPIRNSIDFRNVSFSYENKRVLENVDLHVKAGEVIALVGSSGAGKTTMVNLIPRFYDVSEGAILIDDLDIRDATIRSLRNQIAIVTQQSFLFNDSIRNNIAYGDFDKNDAGIITAAKAAYAYDFITQMPEGFDTVIGEQGVKLSGGQRQRLCIARAIFKNAPILILDEATSSLDSESELEVQMALDNLMQGRTTFVIAHRLSTIQSATRILVLSNGKIVEEGTQTSLLREDGEYRRLYDIQFMKMSV